MKVSNHVLLTLSVLMALSQPVFAQVESQTLSAEVDSEIDSMYKSNQTQSALTSQPAQRSVVTQTVVVPTVQKQPVTVVEASPLADSRADGIRRNRQDEEMRTESRIVEKLEQSRLEDEKRRASVLFGDKFDNLNNQQSQPIPVTAPSSHVAPKVETVIVQTQPAQAEAQPIVIQQNETLTRDAVREEMRAALDEQETAVTPVINQKYFAGVAGIAQYPDSETAKGNYSLGATFGSRMGLFMVEGSFIYSNYTVAGVAYWPSGYTYIPVTYLDFYTMNQYQGAFGAKYQLLDGFVRPYLGGLVSYSYRTYVSNFAYFNRGAGSVDAKSHAIDLGTDVGVDLEFNDRISMGASFKYLFNMASRIDGDTAANGKTLEKQQYYQVGLVARVNF